MQHRSPPRCRRSSTPASPRCAAAGVVTRRDGVVLGFTDHDDDIVLDGVTLPRRHRACGLGSDRSSSASRCTGTEISGALADESLTEDDLAAGRYDAADDRNLPRRLERADAARAARARACSARCGARALAFTAELRSLAQPARRGDAAGSSRRPARPISATRAAPSTSPTRPFTAPARSRRSTATSIFRASGLDGFADGWFTAGKLTFTSGANNGLAIEVKTHRVDARRRARSSCGRRCREPIAPGDTFAVTAGCDKRFATCRDRFANARQLPRLPANPRQRFRRQLSRSPGEPGNDGTEPDAELDMTSMSLTRSAIVAEARAWIGTPYRHQASLKGVGCDCLGLVRGVWRALCRRRAGARCRPMRPTGPKRRGARRSPRPAGAISPRSIPTQFAPGDVLLFRWRAGFPAKHAAIVTAPDLMVHAHDGAAVAEVAIAPWWRRRLAYAFRFPGVTD